MKARVCLILGMAGLLAGCQSLPPANKLQRFDYTQPHMGTLFRITLYAPEEGLAKIASEAAFRRVAELDQLFSDYNPESELLQLCAQPHGRPVRVSDELFDVLQRSWELSRLTGGAFDVTVGPYVRLWRSARRARQLPSPAQVAEVSEAVGYEKMLLDPVGQRVTLTAPHMRLDLGGIAKGYAADQALAILQKNGVGRAMVAAAGDIALGDPPPDRAGWVIGIASIDSAAGQYTKVIQLANSGVSTSGDTEQFVEINGVRYSHIVDPGTGVGLTERLGVTVIAPDATTSDSLATGISVLGIEQGLALAESHSRTAALIVAIGPDGRKRLVESPRFSTIPSQPPGATVGQP